MSQIFYLGLIFYFLLLRPLRNPEDRSRPLVTCTGNPCQSTGTSSPVSTGDLPVLPVQVTNVLSFPQYAVPK